MPKLMRLSVMLAAAVTLLVLAAPMASAQDAFRGTWTSIDTDGSNQTLWIRGSGQEGRYSVSLLDDAATRACDGAPARAQGAGAVQGDTLTWSGTVTCPGTGRGPVTGRVDVSALTHDPATDTLTDDSGVLWNRSD